MVRIPASAVSPAVAFLVAALGIALFSVMDALMKGLVLAIGVYNTMLWRSLGNIALGAAAWGVAGLATGAAITGLVNEAADQQSTVIVVPQTEYQLNFGTVEAVGSAGVSFNYGVGNTELMGAANCQDGLLNGQVPSNADQAQLLNAVCQVAYGSGGS
jgi:hypothetical protein